MRGGGTILTKKLFAILLILFSVFISYTVWNWDGSPPTIDWKQAPATVGKATRFALEVRDEGKGLRSLEVVFIQAQRRRILVSEEYASSWLSWRKGLHQRTITLSPEIAFGEVPLSDGEFRLQVQVSDQTNLGLWNRQTSQVRSFLLDLQPPRIEVLSQQHYIRQGGSEAILYRTTTDCVSSGVVVGDRAFIGYPLPQQDQGLSICLFALSVEDPPETPMYVWGEDAVGNRVQAGFWKKTFPTQFRQRDIVLTDTFVQKVVLEILRHGSEMSRKDSLLESFLQINGQLRETNHQRITGISHQSVGRLLWEKPFLQLSNSQVESVFADRRSYYYQEKKVDEQTHLGFDLASVAHSAVECANDGTVLFADHLGIYGKCVLVDHGLGLLSLYGHLSSIEVKPGERVTRGQRLGSTGETGLAGGDHLHFSMVLQGVHVNPLEWWDGKWVDQHVLAKVKRK